MTGSCARRRPFRPIRRLSHRALGVAAALAGVLAAAGCGSRSGDQTREDGGRRDIVTSANPVVDESHGPMPVLKKDPFQIKANSPRHVTRRATSQAGGSTPPVQRTTRQTPIETAGTELILKAILMGNNPAAIVDGKIVRVGDRVASSAGDCHYNVTDITRDSVVLLAEWPNTGVTKTVTLELDVKIAGE